jgi:hypothetical protein
MQTVILALPPILSLYYPPSFPPIPLYNSTNQLVGFIRHAAHIPLPPDEILIVFRNRQTPTPAQHRRRQLARPPLRLPPRPEGYRHTDRDCDREGRRLLQRRQRQPRSRHHHQPPHQCARLSSSSWMTTPAIRCPGGEMKRLRRKRLRRPVLRQMGTTNSNRIVDFEGFGQYLILGSRSAPRQHLDTGRQQRVPGCGSHRESAG